MNQKVTILLFLMLFILIAIGDAYSVDKQWIGNGLGNGRFRGVAANWSPAGVPTSSDDVYFNSPTAGNCQIDVAAYCRSFNQSASPGTRDFANNATLTVGVGGVFISGGNLAMGASSNSIIVQGNWFQTGGTFDADAATIMFNGTNLQTLQTLVPFFNVTIVNPSSVLLNSDLSVNGVLLLTSGVLSTGQYSLMINQTGSVTRITGHVEGNLQKYIPTGATTRTFEIGDATFYSPVTVSFNNVTVAGRLTAEVYAEEHGNIANSPVNESKNVNRFWIFSNSGIVFNNYSATLNFVASDKDPGADATKFIVGKSDGANWTMPTVGTRTGTSIQATGMTTMSDFAVGEIKTFTIAAAAGANGLISPSGNVSVNWGSNQLFTFTPSAGFHIGDVVVDGGSLGVVPNYTFTNVREPHTISVNFLADTVTIAATAGSNGSISPSGNVRVPSLGSQMFAITPDAGYHVDDVLVNGSSVGAVTEYEFTNVTVDQTIHAVFAINKFTITSTADPNGTINPLGTTEVSYGADITYTIIPDYGYHVDSLFVDGTHVDSTTSYTYYNVIEDHSIHATFAINHYTITAIAGPNGTIDPSGLVDVEHGSSKTFTITPDYGFHIDTLMVDGVLQTPNDSYTFENIESDHFIYVTFAINYYAITANASDGGEIDPEGTLYVIHGGSQQFTVSPDFGYHLDGLFVDGLHVDSTSSYTFDNVTSDHTIYAAFAINKYVINATAGDNGTISPYGSVAVDHGSDQHFSIIPDMGYHVDNLFVDDTHVDSTTSYAFYNVMEGHTIHAEFAINMYTITASAGPNGSIDPLGIATLPYGSDQMYTIVPDEGYHIDSLIVDDESITPTSPYTFYDVDNNHTIRVVFKLNSYAIDAAAISGSITPSGTVIVDHGSDQKFTFEPEVGHHFDSLFVDGVHSDTATTSYTFFNITTSHSILAKFSINKYTITASAGPNGSINPVGSVVADYGMDKRFVFLPATGYYVDSVIVDGVKQDSIQGYTFYNVTDDHTIRVTFAIYIYTINATVSGSGTINPSGAVGVNYGETKKFTITPNAGQYIDSLIVDGVKVDSTTSYTFYNIIANHTVHAIFKPFIYTITATTFGLGSISPSGAVQVVYGQNQKFTMTPAVGFDVVALYIDGNLVDSGRSYTFYNVTVNHTIHAIFGQVINPLPTLSSIAPINGNRGETHNVLFIGTNFAPGITSVYVGEGITVNYIVFFPSSSESLSANVTIRKSAVPGTRNFAVVNAPPGGGSSTSQTFTILNSAPTAPRLSAPADQTTINIPPEDPIGFNWTRSIDGDIVDTVKYSIHIWGPGFDTTQAGLKDSSISMDIIPLLELTQWYQWTVKATDGFITTISPDTFMFRIELAVKVDDLLSQIPTEYALHQNYPNPFNPSTKIQVDIPSQAGVTLKVYNLLGTEVANFADNHLMEAGVKFFNLDASNLPSGIYFYRLTANGIDGKTFTSVKRMMLMK
ncbi:MAG: T9SS type A sorting domain-containing protein [Bacteroidota bacterium]|nr:T9SS type A sorting domain-containing protein [Bacteroidota bacterium]